MTNQIDLHRTESSLFDFNNGKESYVGTLHMIIIIFTYFLMKISY